MEDNSKLFVFDKKEVALIFLFMIIISVMSFTFGFHLGKKASFENSGLTSADKQRISLKSDQEEDVEKVVEGAKNQESTEEKGVESPASEELKTEALGQLKNEFEMLDKEMGAKNSTESKVAASTSSTAPEAKTESLPSMTSKLSEEEQSQGVQDSKKYVGKFTIQLGSHPTLKEAKEFADAFTIRGYNPIINQVSIPGRGTWYRVGLGLFASMNEAKDYVKKEEALFHGQEYVIVEIK